MDALLPSLRSPTAAMHSVLRDHCPVLTQILVRDHSKQVCHGEGGWGCKKGAGVPGTATLYQEVAFCAGRSEHRADQNRRRGGKLWASALSTVLYSHPLPSCPSLLPQTTDFQTRPQTHVPPALRVHVNDRTRVMSRLDPRSWTVPRGRSSLAFGLHRQRQCLRVTHGQTYPTVSPDPPGVRNRSQIPPGSPVCTHRIHH